MVLAHFHKTVSLDLINRHVCSSDLSRFSFRGIIEQQVFLIFGASYSEAELLFL